MQEVVEGLRVTEREERNTEEVSWAGRRRVSRTEGREPITHQITSSKHLPSSSSIATGWAGSGRG